MKLLNGEILGNKKYGENLYKIEVFSPYICRNALPGQFVEVKCSYEHLTDPLLRRPFSICEIDRRFNVFSLLFTVRGKGTAFMTKLKKGETLNFIGPLGEGLKFNEGHLKYVLIGGGIGVAPLCFIANELITKENDVLFMAGFKDNSFYAWERDLIKITRNYKIFTEDGSRGEYGIPAAHVSKNLKEYKNCTFIICGPVEMLKALQGILKKAGKVRALALMEERMACGIGVCMGCVIKIKGTDGGFNYRKVCSDGPVFDLMEVIFD